MKSFPANQEKRRLAVLWDYQILDTAPESAFDDLTELASEICATPIATITFIDERRQWFKSKVGLDAQETARDISFCAHTLGSSELVIVPDATKDPRFANNPLVTGSPGIRFYAGAPLIDSNGFALGTICVIDQIPRELNAAQARALKVLARHTVALLELRRRVKDAAKIDEARQLAEEKYQRIFQHSVEGIFQTSVEGRYLNANPAIAHMLGYASPEEVVASIHDISRDLYVHAHERERFVRLIESEGVVRDFEAEFFRKDGSIIWVRTSAHAVRDDSGKILFYEGTSQDITAQVEAKFKLSQSESQYRLLFEGNPHPMWVFDQKTLCFLEVNEAAVQHYGYSREEFLRMTIRDIRPHEDVAAHTEYHAKVLQGLVKISLKEPTLWRHRKKDGTIIDVEIKWTPIEFKNTKAQLVLANDITERRRVEFQTAAFARLAQNLSNTNSAEQAARVIAEAADRLLGWDACSLDLYSPDENLIQPILNIDIVDGARADVPPAYETKEPSPRIADVIKTGGTLILRNAARPAAGPGLRAFGNTSRLSASILFVPIRNVKKVIGILSIQSYTLNAYNEKGLEILQALADQCGGALERIGAKDKLVKERHLLRTLLDHLPDHIFVKDLESRHLLINKAQFKLRGMTDDAEVIGKTLFEISPPEVARKYLEDDQQVFQTGQPLIDREEQVIDTEGNVHCMLTTKVPLRDKDGTISGLVGISRDVTERKRIELALRETEEMFRLISENISDLITVVDANGNRLYSSPSYQLIFGKYGKSIEESDSFSQIHPEDRERVRAVFADTFRTGVGQLTEYRLLLPDKSTRHIESQGNFVPATNASSAKLVIVSRDISDRKRIEVRNASLSRLGQNLAAATSPKEAAQVISKTTRELFSWDFFKLDLYSARADKIYPILNLDTIAGKLTEVSQFVPGKPTVLLRQVIEGGPKLVLKKPPLTMMPDALPLGDVQRPSASLMFVPIKTGTEVIGVISIQSYTLNAYTKQDLEALQSMADHCGGAMERIRAEEALRTSEVRFHSVWENSVDGMRLTDENGIIVAVNKSFCKLVDMSRDELEGHPFTVTYASSVDHASLLQRYKSRFRDRTVQRFFERKMLFRSGKAAELGGANSFVDLEGERPLLLALFRDITEQKRLENQLRQAQKMDSIGQLAGGIAHDFNNLLTIIQGHASLLIARENDSDASDSLHQIAGAAERSANLTRQLLTFSRRQVMQRRALDLKDVVEEMSKMLRRILGEDIVLKVENSRNLPLIRADRSMMEQILLNLAVNSRDAMPRGGELHIATKHRRIDETYTRQNPDAYLGDFVCLTVGDNGCGIPSENLVHIFEPFFTTKEVGKGTGLGLATVYGIVKQHDGWIEVTSELERGTIFNIFFPLSSESRDIAQKAAEKESPRGTETILVVEDEVPLRELVTFLLKRQGYDVLEAGSGREALEVWKNHKRSINLLLTDLVMPEGMTGGELSKQLTSQDANLKVIFTSGYSADIVGKDFVLREGINFLQKPYHPDKLAKTVRDCLDR